jgi:hypothetical protein
MNLKPFGGVLINQTVDLIGVEGGAYIRGSSREVGDCRLVVKAEEYEATSAAVPHGDAPPYDLRLSLRGIWIEPAFELNREALSRIVDELLNHFWARRHVRFSPLLGCVAAPLLHEVLSVRIEDVSFPAVCRAFPSGRCWVRTSDLCRVKAALSR